MAAELFEIMYKQMLNIASDEDFPDSEYVAGLWMGYDPTRVDIDWDKLSDKEAAIKKEECKGNIKKLLGDLDKQFNTGKQVDAKVWTEDLMHLVNHAFVTEFIDNGVPILGFWSQSGKNSEHLDRYTKQILNILQKFDFEVPQEELKERRERIVRRAYYALSLVGNEQIVPLATSGAFWTIYKSFERSPAVLREVSTIILIFYLFTITPSVQLHFTRSGSINHRLITSPIDEIRVWCLTRREQHWCCSRQVLSRTCPCREQRLRCSWQVLT